MKLKDNEYLTLTYSMTSSPTDYDTSCTTVYNVNVFVHDTDTDKEKIIGKAVLKHYNFALCDDIGFAYDDTILSISDEEPLEIFIDELGGYRQEWEDMLLDSMSKNILCVDKLSLCPEYRGKGVGMMVFKDIYTRFYNNIAFIVLKAAPLQFDQSLINDDPDWNEIMQFDEMEKDEKKAIKKLGDFYKSVGFTRYKRSPIFYLPTFYEDNNLFRMIKEI